MCVAMATLTHNSGFKTTSFSCCNVLYMLSAHSLQFVQWPNTYKSFLRVYVCVSGIFDIMKHLTANMRVIGLVRVVVEFCFENAESRIPSCDLLRRLFA